MNTDVDDDARKAAARERSRRWYAANKERASERGKQYYAANRDEIKQRVREYREENREAIAERVKQYNQASPEPQRQRSRRWKAAHQDQVKASSARYRDSLRDQVFDHYGQACACCSTTEKLSIDHVNGDGAEHREELFRSNQGNTFNFYRWLIDNGFPGGFQVLCKPCNGSKRNGEHCRIDHLREGA